MAAAGRGPAPGPARESQDPVKTLLISPLGYPPLTALCDSPRRITLDFGTQCHNRALIGLVLLNELYFQRLLS